MTILIKFCEQLSQKRPVTLPEDYHMDNIAFNKNSYNYDELGDLENAHSILDAYLWLANRFEHQFTETELCHVLRIKVQELIEGVLMAKH